MGHALRRQAGVGISLIHTWFFSAHPSAAEFWHTLFEDVATTLGIAAGQVRWPW